MNQQVKELTNVASRESFSMRHLGPNEDECRKMLTELGYKSLADFISAVLPSSIRRQKKFQMSDFNLPLDERAATERLRNLSKKNKVARSLIGMGYSDCITPTVIQRNILENPGWYTQYTPYQPEISQGRLEALLNYQTVVTDLTGFDIANASLLDEGTAAAEAMNLCLQVSKKNLSGGKAKFLIAKDCHPQTIAVVETRAKVLDLETAIADPENFSFDENVFGILLQYPSTYGSISDYREIIKMAKSHNVLTVIAADILALTLLMPPAILGADVAVGSTQRFGVPLGFGGPHAAYFATRDEHKRLMPGRLVGVSKDSRGMPALRLALQTREQHIRREKATSNICTAQVLLAVMAGMYAVYHGPEGLKKIAERVKFLTALFAQGIRKLGHKLESEFFFDTVVVHLKDDSKQSIFKKAQSLGYNLRDVSDKKIGVSFDEISTLEEVATVLEIFGHKFSDSAIEREKELSQLSNQLGDSIPAALKRNGEFLKHEVFQRYRSETEFLRYVRSLEAKDLSLTASMIPLGSCTMKLNASSEMYPVSWPEFSSVHPFSPEEQVSGYRAMFQELERALAEITGFDAVSLQPNSGSQGEYAGLLAIRAYLDSNGQRERNICLIPKSAHGTNPASAAMVSMQVVVVECDDKGNVNLEDLTNKVNQYKDHLACLMITYPSTHGVFEESIKEVTQLVHAAGGQVYMDGANLNALVGLSSPEELGADVCHINLHKTFCIPHGGGGPGMGPIAMRKHLAPFMPSHPCVEGAGKNSLGPVSAAPWGSASILVIPWMYIAMMGTDGLKQATEIAILNANYVAKRLDKYYPVLFKGQNDLVAHECILDLRPLKKTSNIEVEDVAKRLMDYGFHAPTVSFPVAGTLMVEPTESESLYELDRFCDAMISIWYEIKEVADGKIDLNNNPLKNAPHTAQAIASDSWDRPYSRERAAFPSEHVRKNKFWPAVGRIDGVYGDRNLFCTCS